MRAFTLMSTFGLGLMLIGCAGAPETPQTSEISPAEKAALRAKDHPRLPPTGSHIYQGPDAKITGDSSITVDRDELDRVMTTPDLARALRRSSAGPSLGSP